MLAERDLLGRGRVVFGNEHRLFLKSERQLRSTLGAFPELIRSLGNSIKGKVVINASNPFPQRDGEIANDARAKGVGLFDAQMLPGAHVVRAFNAVSAARMASAHEDPGKIGMPIAGDDKKAIEVASRLVHGLVT